MWQRPEPEQHEGKTSRAAQRGQTLQQDILTEAGFPLGNLPQVKALAVCPPEGGSSISQSSSGDVSSDSGARQSVRASSQALAVVTNWTAGLQNVTEQTSSKRAPGTWQQGGDAQGVLPHQLSVDTEPNSQPSASLGHHCPSLQLKCKA